MAYRGLEFVPVFVAATGIRKSSLVVVFWNCGAKLPERSAVKEISCGRILQHGRRFCGSAGQMRPMDSQRKPIV